MWFSLYYQFKNNLKIRHIEIRIIYINFSYFLLVLLQGNATFSNLSKQGFEKLLLISVLGKKDREFQYHIVLRNIIPRNTFKNGSLNLKSCDTGKIIN